MKKIATILALTVLVLATSCKKLPEFTSGGSSSGGDTPTTGGTLYYHLNGEPEIGSDFISISAKYGSKNEITGMWLLVSEKADMPAGFTHYADIQMNYPEFSVTLTGLQPETHYYWCINYLEDENSYVTDTVEFTTLSE
ncbi:MAG: fibronectin type III domain-containing protein [Bacteroidales bacterium]|nr:fibronectin type III domain-containing protein [Bacteroidales bacterium]